ncbi:hypothetical protein HZH68_000439 [Vespula germanica]|uniref:Uncharacterized protein n=1 Tax=Vespula germanica TaxID=30212 RepID=A0A834NTT8_VESGE|nr:hypothetical protein HZH68_000439 [Vespula germanica]
MMNYDWSRRFSTVHKATSGTMVKVARPLNDRQVNEAAFEINVPRDIRMLSRDSILDAPRDSRETILVDDTFGLQARIARHSVEYDSKGGEGKGKDVTSKFISVGFREKRTPGFHYILMELYSRERANDLYR